MHAIPKATKDVAETSILPISFANLGGHAHQRITNTLVVSLDFAAFRCGVLAGCLDGFEERLQYQVRQMTPCKLMARRGVNANFKPVHYHRTRENSVVIILVIFTFIGIVGSTIGIVVQSVQSICTIGIAEVQKKTKDSPLLCLSFSAFQVAKVH